MAEQEKPVRRKVALKIIKPGMDTRQVMARFEAEENALALMDHPNIARVFDAGATDTGRPYFVMELVRGVPITDYCDRHQLSMRERLELFMSVCQALHHAHQKGIIHRDIKPSNVLVTSYNSEPAVKVIDFGVAKAINQRLTEQTLFTQFNDLVGTPLYMSPEQADLGGLDVDVRTDVYSLGVVLYELLTGTTPVEKNRLAGMRSDCDELRRILREEEPPKPSTRVSTLGEAVDTIASHRHTEPRKLALLIRGDLDWIVMKALEKDRTRRYDGAKELADDLRRFLNDEPPLASPPSTAYRVRKFMKRNRRRIAITTATLAALCLIAMLTWNWHSESRERVRIQKLGEQQREARKEWLPEIDQLIADEKMVEAFELASKARRIIPDDPTLARIWGQVAVNANIHADPADAKIFVRDWRALEGAWMPVNNRDENLTLPQGMLRWRVTCPDYHPLEMIRDASDSALIKLEPEHMVPKNTRRVTRPGDDVGILFDRLEVSNREFQRFVDSGGYRNRRWWKHDFVRDGEVIQWDEVMKLLVDSTNQPGPANWHEGHYREGEGDLPVRGISWYEASAYAEFVGKSLPTIEDWLHAANRVNSEYFLPHSNFSGTGPQAVGATQAVNAYGLCDMAGNVREWCLNPARSGEYCMRGGSWEDPSYMLDFVATAAGLERRGDVGFRCVHYRKRPTASRYTSSQEGAEAVTALPEEEFEAYRIVYAYDRQAPLNTTPASAKSSYPGLRHEVVTIDAAYGGERFDIHLMLPENSQPPYQAILFYPGTGVFKIDRFGDMTGAAMRAALILAHHGRAICWPVYKGAFHRRVRLPGSMQSRLQASKDVFRALDYLSTRKDIDAERISYAGYSWGAWIAPCHVSLEPRFKACVLVGGGFPKRQSPQIDPRSFAPRVDMPVLMINGDRDDIFPLESSQKPLFHSLGSEDKHHRVISNCGHVVPLSAIDQANMWLDNRLGRPQTAKAMEGLSPLELAKSLESRAALRLSQDAPEAVQMLQQALDIRVRIQGQFDRDTLRTMHQIAKALDNASQPRAAQQQYQETLQAQRRHLGAADQDTRSTFRDLRDFCVGSMFSVLDNKNATRQQLELAAVIGQAGGETIAEENENTFSVWWLVAAVNHRLGSPKTAREALDRSFATDSPNAIVFALRSIISWNDGQYDLTQDWYAATVEMSGRSGNSGSSMLRRFKAEAAELLQIVDDTDVEIETPAKQIAIYNRLIECYPDASHLLYRRGVCYGRGAGDWNRALADFQAAVDLHARPSFSHFQALAVAALYLGDRQTYRRICELAWQEFHDFPGHFRGWQQANVRAKLVILCALNPVSEVTPSELIAVAEPLNRQDEPFLTRLAAAMAYYRAGDVDRAFDMWPSEIHPYSELSLAFHAVVHASVRNDYSAQRLLTKSQSMVDRRLSSPDGPELAQDSDSRPILWCLANIALNQAKAKIQSE